MTKVPSVPRVPRVPGVPGVRYVAVLVALAALSFSFAPAVIRAQVPGISSDRFKGLQWTFVRIKYNSWEDEGAATGNRLAYWDEPWAIDAPAAEQNLSRWWDPSERKSS